MTDVHVRQQEAASYDLNHNTVLQEKTTTTTTSAAVSTSSSIDDRLSASSSNGSISAAPLQTETDKFYSHSKDYWAKQPATVNGMLGGYDYVSTPDIQQSQHFLDYFTKANAAQYKMERKLALDCGAGIGRVSKGLLLRNFDHVEMVDVTENFMEKAREYLGEADFARVLKFHCTGLQSFTPEAGKYDCIWVQWVLGYLNDKDLVEFFKRCKQALKPNGICVLKENVSKSENEFDEVDSSYTRPRQAYVNAIHKAGMHMIRDEKQRKFPSELYEVRLIAFK